MHVHKKIKFEISTIIFDSKYFIKDFAAYMKEKYCKMPKPIKIKIDKK
ncbi:MAG: hypothetical protein KDC90_04360 [Ignavibacteriae bacterium]|nr:hypothetical protein [Ignavibacteriota bacterium]